MNAPAHVVVNGKRRPIERATFGISVQAESWDDETKSYKQGIEHGAVRYWLHVKVDEHSGEDGAPAPDVEDIPVPRAAGGRHPSLETLAGLTVEEIDDGYDFDEWDAWFGNDAPNLFANVVRFQGWEGAGLRIRWESRYHDRSKVKRLVVEGVVEFTGIHVTVRPDEDPDRFLEAIWGGQPAATLERYLLGRHDYGAQFEPERRHTVTYLYMPKGQPASTYWRVGDTVPPDPIPAPPAAVEPPPPQLPRSLGPVSAGRLTDVRGIFSLTAPEGWESFEDVMTAALGGLSIRPVAAPTATLRALAPTLWPGIGLKSYVAKSTAAYRQIWTVEDERAATVGGRPAIRLLLSQAMDGRVWRILKYYVLARERAVIVLSCGTPPEIFAEHLPAFEAIASSLQCHVRPMPDDDDAGGRRARKRPRAKTRGKAKVRKTAAKKKPEKKKPAATKKTAKKKTTKALARARRPRTRR